MAKPIIPLTTKQCDNVKPQEKPVYLFDGGGLYLEVSPAGGKLWRYKYSFDGKPRLMALGKYPTVTLAEARKAVTAAKEMQETGIDPLEHRQGVERKKRRAKASTFEVVAKEWYDETHEGWSANQQTQTARFLRDYINPAIGKTPVDELTPVEVLDAIRPIFKRGIQETAVRCFGVVSFVCRYAVALGLMQRDVTADIKGVIKRKTPIAHRQTVLDPQEVGGLLRSIDAYGGGVEVKSILKLLPLLFCRPGELLHMEWSELDLDAAMWIIPAEKMKMGVEHSIPLSRQALDILRHVKECTTKKSRYVFPSQRSIYRPIAQTSINAALFRLDYKGKQTPHGFRAMARTILDQTLGFRPDWIEHQLAHAVKDPNGRAYNRTTHLEGRRKMMQEWADYLDRLKKGGEVIQLRRVK